MSHSSTIAAARPGTPSSVPPASAIFKRYSNDLLSLPGSIFTGWASKEPNQVHLVFEAGGFEDLARAVLRDSVDGIKIALKTYTPPPGGSGGAASAATGASLATRESVPWQFNVSNMRRAVAAMPGVWDSEVDRTDITFATVTKQQATHLSQLVRDAFGGYTIHFRARLPHPAPPSDS